MPIPLAGLHPPPDPLPQCEAIQRRVGGGAEAAVAPGVEGEALRASGAEGRALRLDIVGAGDDGDEGGAGARSPEGLDDADERLLAQPPAPARQAGKDLGQQFGHRPVVVVVQWKKFARRLHSGVDVDASHITARRREVRCRRVIPASGGSGIELGAEAADGGPPRCVVLYEHVNALQEPAGRAGVLQWPVVEHPVAQHQRIARDLLQVILDIRQEGLLIGKGLVPRRGTVAAPGDGGKQQARALALVIMQRAGDLAIDHA